MPQGALVEGALLAYQGPVSVTPINSVRSETMTTALASLASGRPVRSTVGMTGEVTLQGRVLPIGGVKQKLLAAHRAGLTDVIIPKRNEPDLDDLPESVRSELRIHPVADVKDVLELALEPAPVSAAA